MEKYVETLHYTDVFSCLNPQLVSCSVSSYQHSSVSLEFFETVVRYDKFFIVEPQHIPNVLVSDFFDKVDKVESSLLVRFLLVVNQI